MSSQKDIQKSYRLRLKARLGETEYKNLEATKRKARREAARTRARTPTTTTTTQAATTPATTTPAPVISASAEPDGLNEIREIIKLLNNFLNQPNKLKLPDIAGKIRTDLIPSMVQLQQNTNCDAVFEAVYLARLNLIPTLKKDKFKKLQWAGVINLYKKMFNRKDYDCSNMNWLKETTKIIKYIKTTYTNKNTQITKFSNIAAILSVLDGFEDEYKLFSTISTTERTEQNKQDDLNLTTEKERPNMLKWSELKNLYKDRSLDLKTRSLIGLYTVIPPRRTELGGLLTISYNETDLNPNLNYLIIDETTKTPKKIIMLKYKTFSTYGKYEIKLTNKTYISILKKYITDRGLIAGNPVFGTGEGRYYRNFSLIISDYFKRATKKNISVNILRHSYISDFLSKPRSVAEKKELARQMGHTSTVQELYNRMDL